MEGSANSWIEQLYAYVESYYWVPQDLNMKVIKPNSFKEVQKKIHNLEVPLNGIFNIGLRLLPTKTVQGILSCFTGDDGLLLGNPFELANFFDLTGKDGEFCQPDVTLENDIARVFIELKVKDYLSLEQAQKYIFSHALWNWKHPETKKTPYLLFLTKKSIDKQWKAAERAVIFNENGSVNSLLEYLKTQRTLPESLGGKSLTYLHEEVNNVLDNLVIGATTWENLGHYLQKEYDALTGKGEALAGGDEVIGRLIGDFLAELQRRKLWAKL